jgi:hypothetical protein
MNNAEEGKSPDQHDGSLTTSSKKVIGMPCST